MGTNTQILLSKFAHWNLLLPPTATNPEGIVAYLL
jgi:hypothetical protein